MKHFYHNIPQRPAADGHDQEARPAPGKKGRGQATLRLVRRRLTGGRHSSATPTAVSSSSTPGPSRPDASAAGLPPDRDDCAAEAGTTTAIPLSHARRYDLVRHKKPSRHDWSWGGELGV